VPLPDGALLPVKGNTSDKFSLLDSMSCDALGSAKLKAAKDVEASVKSDSCEKSQEGLENNKFVSLNEGKGFLETVRTDEE
jgi:hypothetical protein